MGYRYTDDEIERLRMDDTYTRALKVARAAKVHIEPSRDDYEAIEFLTNVYRTAVEVNEYGPESSVLFYDRSEYAENVVPYNDYKCGMIFAQLGLWFLRMQTTLDQDYIDGIRFILFTTALEALNEMLDYDFYPVGDL